MKTPRQLSRKELLEIVDDQFESPFNKIVAELELLDRNVYSLGGD